MSAVDLIERSAGETVVVYGTPPPDGHDLDIVMRDATADRLRTALHEAGYEPYGGTWVRFHGGRVEAVDLTTTGRWGLAPDIAADLLTRAEPLPGAALLSEPAPVHRLLIEARRFALSRGAMTERSRTRVARALADDPDAWDEAEGLASSWAAGSALLCLRDSLGGDRPAEARVEEARQEVLRARGARTPRLRPLSDRLPRRRRGSIIAVSGLDGSGKSGQAHRLADSLETLGLETVVVWTRLGSGARLRNVGRPGKRVLRTITRSAPATDVQSRYAHHVEPPDVARASRERWRWLTFLWVLFVVVDHVLEQRRTVSSHVRAGKVVVCDRWTLDSVVHTRYRYGASTPLAVHEVLLRRLAPRTRVDFLLEVPPEVAFMRKPDQYTAEQLGRQADLYASVAPELGVVRVDGTLRVEDIADVLGRHTWAVLRREPAWRRRIKATLIRSPTPPRGR